MSNESLNSLIDVAMIKGLNYLPKPFQQQVLSHILSMVDNNAQAFPLNHTALQTSNNNTSPASNSSMHCRNCRQPVLIVHKTGGSKSSICQTIGFVKDGIHLIIQNTLSLSSDQLSKVDSMHDKCVLAFQLDSIKQSSMRKDLIQPRILCATSACIGAGLDLSQVYLVFCDGLPPSIIDFAQEMGRCGRRPLSTINLGNDRNNDDMFYLVITIESYCYMLLRIYDTSDTLSDCEAKLLERIISLDD